MDRARSGVFPEPVRFCRERMTEPRKGSFNAPITRAIFERSVPVTLGRVSPAPEIFRSQSDRRSRPQFGACFLSGPRLDQTIKPAPLAGRIAHGRAQTGRTVCREFHGGDPQRLLGQVPLERRVCGSNALSRYSPGPAGPLCGRPTARSAYCRGAAIMARRLGGDSLAR
jgi:hypothetical protein